MRNDSYPKIKNDLINLRRERRVKKNKIISDFKNDSQSMHLEFFKYPEYLVNDLILSTKWLFNGFIIKAGELNMLVDPGAELLSRIHDITSLLRLNTLFISHSHIDHYSSAEVALEFMKLGNSNRTLCILGSSKVFRDKAISDYHLNLTSKFTSTEIIQLKHNHKVQIFNSELIPVKLYHSIEGTFGFILNIQNISIGYISDTGYTKTFQTSTGKTYSSGDKEYQGDFEKIITKHNWIKKYFSKVDYLIANVHDLLFTSHSEFHMTGFDLIDILKKSAIKLCVIPNLHPVDLLHYNSASRTAAFISEKSGIRVITVPAEGKIIRLSK